VNFRPTQPSNLAGALAGKHEQFDYRSVMVILKRVPDQAEFGEVEHTLARFLLRPLEADEWIVLDQAVVHCPREQPRQR
jgi:hypothetical protein